MPERSREGVIMARLATLEILQTDLEQHPAVTAWADLRLVRVVPAEIEVLKRRGDSRIYPRVAVGDGGSNEAFLR